MVNGIYPWYSISNFGRIYSTYSNKILKPGIDSKGYYYVALSTQYGPKNMRAHRLVMLAFDNNDNMAKNYITNHMDGNKLNNNIWNLERTDYSGNAKHAYSMGLISNKNNGSLSADQVNEICKLLVENKLNTRQIAELFDTTEDIIYSISCRKAYTFISNKYKLINRKNKSLSNKQVEILCDYFQNNPRNKSIPIYIKEAYEVLGFEINEKSLDLGYRVLVRKSFKSISNKYIF